MTNDATATTSGQSLSTSSSPIKESSLVSISQESSTANIQSIPQSTTAIQPTLFTSSGTVIGPHLDSLNGNTGSTLGASGSTSLSSHEQSALTSSLSTATPVPTQPRSNVQSQMSSASTSNPLPTAAVQFGQSESAYFDSVTAASTLATPMIPGVQYPGTQSGSRAMATGFNEIYKKLDETSQCNPKDANQATACISGELASCQSDGTYVLKSCPDGQSCYALPNSSGLTGINVACAVPADAAAQLSAQSKADYSVGAISQTTSKVQVAVTLAGASSQASSHLPETESVVMPVQQLSSPSHATMTPNDPTPTSGEAQSLTHLPATESVQMPVQISTSSIQASLVPSSQSKASTSLMAAVAPVASQGSGGQSTIHESHSLSAASNSGNQQPKVTALAETQSPASSQVQSPKPSVQTLQSFPAAQATQQSQQTASKSSSNGESAKSANSAQPSPAQSLPADEDGRLFSLPTTTGKDNFQPAKSTEGNGAAQETPKQAPDQSRQELPSSSMETAQVPPPHLAQAISAPLQPTKAASASRPKSSDDDSGIVVVPIGGSDKAAPQGTKEKIAVPNANSNATPIYITVTVTTTAHDRSSTA